MPTIAVLPFPMQHQEADYWCWSAVAVSVDAFRRDGGQTPWAQCTLVNDQLHQTTCCINHDSDECDRPHRLSDALLRLGRLRGAVLNGSLNGASVRLEIDQGRPVGVRIQWFGGEAGHFVLIIGYDDSEAARPQYIIADPFYVQSTVPVAEFPSGYQTQGGNWTHSYLVA